MQQTMYIYYTKRNQVSTYFVDSISEMSHIAHNKSTSMIDFQRIFELVQQQSFSDCNDIS